MKNNNKQDVFMAMSDRFGFYLRFLRSFIKTSKTKYNLTQYKTINNDSSNKMMKKLHKAIKSNQRLSKSIINLRKSIKIDQNRSKVIKRC